MSNNKFYFEFKNKTPKIQDFFPSRSSFYSLKSRVFYLFNFLFNFFSNLIKVKIPNLKNQKNKKLRELLNFSLLFSHVHHIFPTQTFLYITTPLSNTHSKKKLQLLFISEVYPYYYLRGFPYLGSSLFWLKNAHIPLFLSRNKTKGQFGKNTTLTPTKYCLKNRVTLLLNFKLLYPLKHVRLVLFIFFEK